MAAVTRLGTFGVPAGTYGAFAPKDPAPAFGPHDPGPVTRLVSFGICWSRYATFLPKAPAGDESSPKSWITRGPSFGRFSKSKGYSR